jgi:hypothetical protein
MSTSRLSLWSDRSFLSIGSTGSFLSIGSVGSACSVGSVASFGSVCSVASALARWSAFSAAGSGLAFGDPARRPRLVAGAIIVAAGAAIVLSASHDRARAFPGHPRDTSLTRPAGDAAAMERIYPDWLEFHSFDRSSR